MDDYHHASFKETGSYLEMLEPLREYVVDKIINPGTLVTVYIGISEFSLCWILGTI